MNPIHVTILLNHIGGTLCYYILPQQRNSTIHVTTCIFISQQRNPIHVTTCIFISQERNPIHVTTCIFISQQRNPIHVVVPGMEETEEEKPDSDRGFGTMEFAVTRDFSIFKDNVKTSAIEQRNNHSPKVKRKDDDDIDEDELIDVKTMESSLHEMSM